MIHDEDLRAELAARGFAQRIGEWSETEHIHNYFELIGAIASAGSAAVYRPHRAAAAAAEPRPPMAGSGDRKPDAAVWDGNSFPGWS